MSVLITKADGTQEAFDPQKLVHSLTKAGASPGSVEPILKKVEEILRPGMRTADIYRRAFDLLRREREGVAARYSLKRAILDFGPSGFPFEAYLAELFRAKGKEAVIDQIVKGACVEHEVDVVIDEPGIRTFVEAKFHNTPGFKTDLKVTLYVKARLDDLRAAQTGREVRGMVITNTKFTTRAIEYALCGNLILVGWDYPRQGSLQDLIEETGLYPTTALTTLTRAEKNILLAEKIVLCRSLPEQEERLLRLGIKKAKFERIFAEVGALCGSSKR